MPRSGALPVARTLLALAAAASVGCSGFFYFPSPRVTDPPELPGIHFEKQRVTTSDGVRLEAWWFTPRARTPQATFVLFHGNAGNLTHHVGSLGWVLDEGFALLAFDYRGYGRSEGRPSQAGLYRDALAMLAHAAELPTGSWQPDLVLYGQSLGGAVLMRALPDSPHRHRVRAAVIEGSFHSYQEIASSVAWRTPILFPFTGVAYVAVSDRFAPAAHIARIAPLPLLVIHAAHDPIIPFAFGQAIYDLAAPPKALWSVRSHQHIRATALPEVRQALLAWLEQAGTPTSEGTGTAQE